MKKAILIIGLLLATIFGRSQTICGSWSGTMQLREKVIHVIFNVTKNGEEYTTTMDSPTQKIKGFSTTSTEFKNSILTIRMDHADMSYQGKLMETGIMKGVFTQMGKSYSLDLKCKSTYAKKPSKYTVPKRYYAYSYYIDSVKVSNDIQAIVTLPIKKSKTSAIILDCESGYTFSEDGFNNYQNIQKLIDHLTGNGFTVYFSTNGHCDKAAAISYLNSLKSVNNNKISTLKISEYEMTATLSETSKKFSSINKQNTSVNTTGTINQLTNWLLRKA